MENVMITDRTEFPRGETLTVAVNGDGGNRLSGGSFTFTECAFAGGSISIMLACGIETPVENRRRGCVRRMFDHMHKYAAEKGAALGMLHPFLFSYYRKFGYERVADHLIVSFPLRELDFVPRGCEFVPYDETKLSDMISVYEEFGKSRNLLLPRYDGSHYTGGGKQAYIYYENGKPAAYVVLSGSKSLYINNYVNTVLKVNELAYTSPGALKKVFSFLRMFEGEYERAELYDCSLCSEVDMMLRNYVRTSYKILPDISARALDTKKLLEKNVYPEKEGAFTVEVTDALPSAGGVFRVEYGGGKCEVRRTDGKADITLTVAPFTQIVCGYGNYNEYNAAYADGVTVNGDCEDFFRAFPHTPTGVFEHF